MSEAAADMVAVDEPKKEEKEKRKREVDPDRRPAKQVDDPELIAMYSIQQTLIELDEKTQSRVVMWMHDRWLSDEGKS